MLISNINFGKLDKVTNQQINSNFDNMIINFQTFLSILLYANNFKIIQFIRRSLSYIGILNKSVQSNDLNVDISPKINTLTNYQKNY